jgi:hypothetical protein
LEGKFEGQAGNVVPNVHVNAETFQRAFQHSEMKSLYQKGRDLVKRVLTPELPVLTDGEKYK